MEDYKTLRIEEHITPDGEEYQELCKSNPLWKTFKTGEKAYVICCNDTDGDKDSPWILGIHFKRHHAEDYLKYERKKLIFIQLSKAFCKKLSEQQGKSQREFMNSTLAKLELDHTAEIWFEFEKIWADASYHCDGDDDFEEYREWFDDAQRRGCFNLSTNKEKCYEKTKKES